MAKQLQNGPTAPSRRFVWLAAAIVAAIAGWTVLWFVLASVTENRVRAALGDLEGRGVAAGCAGLKVRGYPFRLGVFCDAVTLADRASGISAVAGAFRSAAQIYRLGHIVSELDGRAAFAAGGNALAEIDWASFRASTVFSGGSLDRATVEAKDGRASFRAGATPLEMTMRVSRANLRFVGADVAVRMYFEGVRLPPLPVDLERVLIQMKMPDGALALPEGASRRSWRGRTLELDAFQVEFANGATLDAEGELAVGGTGLVSGRLDVELNGIDTWMNFIRDITTFLPSAAARAIAGVPILIERLVGGGNRLSLGVNIDDGLVRARPFPFPLGRIPPL